METEGVLEEYVDLLQTLIKMNVKPKGKNPVVYYLLPNLKSNKSGNVKLVHLQIIKVNNLHNVLFNT
jgi:hypothetical protein